MRPRTLIASTLAAVTLAILVPSLATAEPIAATDVVVNVTAGANDPVSGATVVARDDRTGRVVSSTTTTGDLGYTVIRLRPGASAQRITITATGGRSQVVGGLSGADVMSATAQRGGIAAEIEVNVNPGSTVLAEYLDVRPGVSIAAAERTVARRIPAGRPGALAGETLIRVPYSRASALRKTPGAWTLTIEARTANGAVASKTLSINVKTK